MLNFLDLPYDVLCVIFSQIPEGVSHGLAPVSMANKRARQKLTPLLFKHVAFMKGEPERPVYWASIEQAIQTLLQNAYIVQSVRCLCFQLWRPFPINAKPDVNKSLPISLASLITSLPNLMRMKLILPRCYLLALQSDLKANQPLATLRSLTVSTYDWIFFVHISHNLEMVHVEDRSSRIPMREALPVIHKYRNITRLSCFERSSAVVINVIAQYLPYLRELGLLAPVDTLTIINGIRRYRQFPNLGTIWLPPLQTKTIDGVGGPRRQTTTDISSLLDAIERHVINDCGPDVRTVKVGWNQLIEVYERRPGRSFMKTMEVTTDVSLRKEVVL
ncbi:hypothetical protein FRC19_000299 [Serendipita sp. 401]|nr:hypothetical protein FRC15_010851 [Serendipita sp. 397]KAG8802256.1 hypothetical protein FRC16_010071 [Serendipita sp. 398]KAG8827794.1 hypothetical protein FRC19_000299 [Serendipita sp. 401]KAG8870737.1 hypothetical protein FRC20_011375 [Serendipita sp. 405]KAG9057989.1 hypothetical protein FS842_002325 [Serendipita sp. 407]